MFPVVKAKWPVLLLALEGALLGRFSVLLDKLDRTGFVPPEVVAIVLAPTDFGGLGGVEHTNCCVEELGDRIPPPLLLLLPPEEPSTLLLLCPETRPPLPPACPPTGVLTLLVSLVGL